MRFPLAVLAAIFAVTTTQAAEYTRLDDQSLPGSTRYERCLSLARISPQAALDAAQEWKSGAAAAEHCAAVALTGLKRYTEAAAKLDLLARDKATGNPAERAMLFDQAGNAWILAVHADQATNSFTAGIALAPGNSDLLTDRARASAMRKDWSAAERDLSAALALDPRNAEILVLRASARHALGHKDDARADVAKALQLRPDDADALLEQGNLKMEGGDAAGAEADWRAAIDANPKGAAAKEARAKLADQEPAKPSAAVPAVP